METFIERVLGLLSSFHKDFIAQNHAAFNRSQITISELWALEYLSGHKEVTMKELSTAVSLQTSSTTSLVDRLIKKGYAMRERCEEDRRIIRVRATPEGRELWSQTMQAKKSNLTKLFRNLTETERAQYLKLLEKIAHQLEEQTHENN